MPDETISEPPRERPTETRPDATPVDPAATQTTRESARDALIAHVQSIQAAMTVLGRELFRADPNSMATRAVRTAIKNASEALLILTPVRGGPDVPGDEDPTDEPDIDPPDIDPPDVDPNVPPDTDDAPPASGAWVNPNDTGADESSLTEQGPATWGHALSTLKDNARITSISKGGGITSTGYGGIGGAPFTLTNSVIEPAPWMPGTIIDGQDGDGRLAARWGGIYYDVERQEYRRITYRNIDDEHGVYGTMVGGALWERCRFENIGSQGLQLVGAVPGTKRAHQTGHQADWKAYTDARQWEWHIVRECAFVEVGKISGGRPSFAFSGFAGVRCPVRIERSYFETKHSQHLAGGVMRDCFGAVMAHGRNRFELLETFIGFENGDRDVVQVWDCGDYQTDTVDVLIRGCEINSNQRIDIRVYDPGAKVTLQGNTGTATVIVHGNPPNIWPTMKAWREDLVIYRGPVSDDYALNA